MNKLFIPLMSVMLFCACSTKKSENVSETEATAASVEAVAVDQKENAEKSNTLELPCSKKQLIDAWQRIGQDEEEYDGYADCSPELYMVSDIDHDGCNEVLLCRSNFSEYESSGWQQAVMAVKDGECSVLVANASPDTQLDISADGVISIVACGFIPAFSTVPFFKVKDSSCQVKGRIESGHLSFDDEGFVNFFVEEEEVSAEAFKAVFGNYTEIPSHTLLDFFEQGLLKEL